MTAALFATVLLLAPTGPSPVIFPQQSLPLNFSHALHLKKNIACEYCHEKAPESTEARDFLVPPESACEDCHPIDRAQPFKQSKVAARCDACHPGWEGKGEPPRVSVPVPHLKFNHKIHVGRGITCQQCHGEMKDIDLATREQLPRMQICLKCHVGGSKAPSRCSTCHLLTPAGTMQVEFNEGKLAPSGAIRGDEHTPDFRRNHASVARNDEEYCLNCHRKNECLQCHNGVVKPLDIHANDYLSIHPIDARRDSIRCRSCHRYQSFCIGCHQRSGVALDVPGGNPTADTKSMLQFHPPGWVESPSEGGFAQNPNHHAWQAMRNIRSCVSCHREQSCEKCHITGIGRDRTVNPALSSTDDWVGWRPHPAHWASLCRTLVSKNKRVCLKCHDVGSHELTCDNAP